MERLSLYEFGRVQFASVCGCSTHSAIFVAKRSADCRVLAGPLGKPAHSRGKQLSLAASVRGGPAADDSVRIDTYETRHSSDLESTCKSGVLR